MHRTRLIAAALAFLSLGLFASTAISQVYQLTPLPIQYARAINDSGSVVGISGGSGAIYMNGTTYGIGGTYPWGSSVALGLNNLDQVVGHAKPHPDSSEHAFLWDNFVITDLGVVSELYNEADAINDLGEIAGTAFDTVGNHPYFWKDGVVTEIPSFGNPRVGGAYGINNAGQVVGASRLDDTIAHAFLWQDGGITDLGVLEGSYYSEAWAINASGQIVGSSSIAGNSGRAAVLWSGGGITNLGYIGEPGGGQGASFGWDLNDAGEVVGMSTWASPNYNYNYHGFVWRNGTMTDLNVAADTSGGWEIINAAGINNKGDIVCTAVNRAAPNFVQSVLLTRGDLLVKAPMAGELWISADTDTIRWKNGLPAGSSVDLSYSLNNGLTWKTIANGVPASAERYAWTVPDTFSAKTRILVASSSDGSKNDTSGLFRMKGYILTKFTEGGDYVPYDFATDRWGFGNNPDEVWPSWWYSRFNYLGTDPFTGKSYLNGGNFQAEYFAAAHSEDHPDWPSFVHTFGYSCYINLVQGIYSPTAVTRWVSYKDEWNGSCFGFAIADAITFRNKAQFMNKYSSFTPYAYPNQALGDTSTLPVINELFTHQFGEPHITYRANVGILKTPTETVNDLKAMLLSDDAPVRTLSIRNNGPDGGGHAIVAYKMKRDPAQSNLYYLSVYDNSHPDNANAMITIDTAEFGGKGSWTYPLWPGWGGPQFLYLRDPAVDYLTNPLLPNNTAEPRTSVFAVPGGLVEISPIRSSSISIRDTLGNATGYVDSVLRSDIPGSVPLAVDNGSKTPPYGYRLPSGPYSITLSRFTGGVSRAFVFQGDLTFGVERSGAAAGQTDRLLFDGGLAVANPDTGVKAIGILHIINEFVHQGREKVYRVRSLPLGQGDSIKAENVNTDGLKLSSFAPSSRTYRLDLEIDSYFSGVKRFTHSNVQLDGNSSHIIRPNWTGLGSGDLKILIDDGNDGTVDDSVFVTNQLTGVSSPGGGETPTAFMLRQNYPNPFNPLTTIDYDLPAESRVVLTVYDVLGQVMAVLRDDVEEAGFKSVSWNASGAPSGIYFYRLEAIRTDDPTESFTEMRKMLLVK
jgi:probable HAF family extracellular repeat protein